MESELLDDETYLELLRDRDEQLTSSQMHQLRQIDRIEAMLNVYEQELSQDIREQAMKTMRRRQMEILTNEVTKPWEKFVEELPDSITAFRL